MKVTYGEALPFSPLDVHLTFIKTNIHLLLSLVGMAFLNLARITVTAILFSPYQDGTRLKKSLRKMRTGPTSQSPAVDTVPQETKKLTITNTFLLLSLVLTTLTVMAARPKEYPSKTPLTWTQNGKKLSRSTLVPTPRSPTIVQVQ